MSETLAFLGKKEGDKTPPGANVCLGREFCSAGPAVAGGVTEAAGALKWGILAAVIFPALLLATFAPFSLRRKTLSDRGR